jgi:hypothetical protein
MVPALLGAFHLFGESPTRGAQRQHADGGNRWGLPAGHGCIAKITLGSSSDFVLLLGGYSFETGISIEVTGSFPFAVHNRRANAPLREAESPSGSYKQKFRQRGFMTGKMGPEETTSKMLDQSRSNSEKFLNFWEDVPMLILTMRLGPVLIFSFGPTPTCF